MTNGDAGNGAAGLEEHPFVAAMRGKAPPAAPADTKIEGYLARDTEPGYWRVYLSSKLETYLRVPEQNILSNAISDQPMGKSVVTLSHTAALDAVTPIPAQLQSSFLAGDFVSSPPPGAVSPAGAGMATTGPCLATLLIAVIIIEQTSPPPGPTAGGEPSVCLC